MPSHFEHEGIPRNATCLANTPLLLPSNTCREIDLFGEGKVGNEFNGSLMGFCPLIFAGNPR